MEKEKTLQNEEPKQKKPKLGMLESNRISVLATEDFKFPDTLIFEDLGSVLMQHFRKIKSL